MGGWRLESVWTPEGGGEEEEEYGHQEEEDYGHLLGCMVVVEEHGCLVEERV